MFVVGVAAIIKAGDVFVTARVAIGRHARIPQAVIRGTLVNLMMTAPGHGTMAIEQR